MTQPQRQDLLIVGRAIRCVREQHGLSAGDLAAAAGVDLARVKALESGRLDPDFELLLQLAEGLGIRPSVFFMRAEELGEQQRSRADSAQDCG